MSETVTVTYGEEIFRAGEYLTYKAGPYSITTQVRPGETPEQAVSRAYLALESVAEKLFERKRNEYIKRLGKMK